MKSCRILSFVLAVSVWPSLAVSQVTFEWVAVGDPGNACDPQSFGCHGAVAYAYRMATHEVTNAQYAAFLNAKAASDPLGLYNTSMAATPGGITRSGSAGSYTYSAIAGRENRPVNMVSFFDALRFANWMHNGQGNGDTETGAYNLLGGTPMPSNGLVERNSDARVFVPSDDEWYKAAFYDSVMGVYFDFPTGTDAQIVCSAPTATPNTANCGNVVASPTDVGSYSASVSPSGTFDQGGNVWEWNEELIVLDHRAFRGSTYNRPAEDLGANDNNNLDYDEPLNERSTLGFRLAAVAEGILCGDGLCEGDEPGTCPSDCPDVCGDGLCTDGEDLQSCPEDCACVANTDCDDGFFCNGSELCLDGACETGAAVNCNDGVACTIDSCDETADACENHPHDAACADLSFCNGVEWCDPVDGCQAGVPIHCDDGIDCTIDACFESTRTCHHIADDDNCPDNDGLFCNGGEVCAPGVGCVPSGSPCDGNETCDESTDSCGPNCQPRWGPCTRNSDCCSNRCLGFWHICR